MWLMTFHAACARILRAEAERLGYTRQFTIYDQADSRRLAKRSADAVGVDPKRFTPARDPQPDLGGEEPPDRRRATTARTVGSPFEEMVADVYDIYERDLHRMNAMDFDDLLFRTVNLLELFEEVRERYRTTFRHVLVDEYQDTNHAQYRLLQLLVGGGRAARGGQGPARRPPGLRRARRVTATWRWSATTRSRSTASAAPTCATSSTSRRTSPTRAWSSSSRTTARPRRSSRPPTR